MGRKARDKKSRSGAAPAPGRPADGAAAGPAAAAAERPGAAPAPKRARPQRPALLPARAFAWALVLLVVTGALYAGAIDNPFLLDDPLNITKNPRLQKPLSLLWLAQDPRAAVTLTLRWNYLAGGFDVRGYHVLNVAMHALTGWLVMVLAWMTLRLEVFGGRYEKSAEWLSLVVALVFLFHPIQTESVTYVIQRAEILASMGLVGALIALVAMKDSVTPAPLAMLVGASLLGMYSKPSFVVVPALLAVYDVCFLARWRVAELAKRWPVYVAAVAAAVMTFMLSRIQGGFASDTAGFDVKGVSQFGYLTAQFGVIVQYLRVTLWPARLCFDCGYRGPWTVHSTWLGDSVVLPAVILLAIGAAALWCWRRRPLVTFAVFASAVVLSPTSTFVTLADYYVEHRMYLPIAFLAMALVPLAWDSLEEGARRLALAPRAALASGVAAAAIVLALLSLLTVRRNQLFANPTAMMEDSLAQAPQNERVQYNLANDYKRDGRFDEAIAHYEEAIRLAPNILRAYENLGSLYSQQGKLDQALAVYRAGSDAKPGVAMGHRNLALTLLKLNRAEEAREAAQKSLEIDPGNANGHRMLGEALWRLGRRSEALETWREGLAKNPSDTDLRNRASRSAGG